MSKIALGKAFRLSFNKSTVKVHLKLGTMLHFYQILALNPIVRTMGIMSRCRFDSHGRHCLFLDYDDCMLDVVYSDILNAQRNYDVGTAVILQSGESDTNLAGNEYSNYHVLCPTKLSFGELCEIIEQTHADENFKTVSSHFNWRSYVLRVYPKFSENGRIIKDRPVLRDVVWSETGREVYQALYEFLMRWYGMPAWEGRLAPNLDGLTELNLLHYPTTMGWTPAIKQRLKSLGAKFKMQVAGVF